MKTLIKLKISILYILLILLSSCFKYKEVDREYEQLKKLPENELTKIDLISYIDMDTVHSEGFETSFKIKNIGKNVMNNIFIKGICSCTTFDFYKKTLLPNQEQNINLRINLLDEDGYFLKEIYVYGTFYPYLRKIQIVGYKN